jgi:hypothetical protein
MGMFFQGDVTKNYKFHEQIGSDGNRKHYTQDNKHRHVGRTDYR